MNSHVITLAFFILIYFACVIFYGILKQKEELTRIHKIGLLVLKILAILGMVVTLIRMKEERKRERYREYTITMLKTL